jgi:parallel beta-helix repeat protein
VLLADGSQLPGAEGLPPIRRGIRLACAPDRSREEAVKPVAAAALVVAAALAIAGPASAQTVRCGEVITKSTKLVTDLVDCPESGLIIGADNIALDLNGHTVDGIGVFDRNGQFAGVDNGAGHDGVKVKNGTVKGFDYGVRLGNALLSAEASVDCNQIRRVTATGNATGLRLVRCQQTVLDQNLVSGGGWEIALANSDQNRIERNIVLGGGIIIDDSSDNRIDRNHLFGPSPIHLDGAISSGNLVRRNRVVGTGPDSGSGVFVGASNSLIQGNVVSDHSGHGIQVAFGVGSRISGNTVLRNGRGGLFVGAGIFVDPDASGTLIVGNTASHNGGPGKPFLIEGRDDGVRVESPSTTLTRNAANGNFDLGLDAASGVTDGGGNRASGNGNPLQCLNVFCR